MQLLPLHGVQRSSAYPFAQFIFYMGAMMGFLNSHIYECLRTLGFVFAQIRGKMNTLYSSILQIVCQWNRERISLCKSGDQPRSFSYLSNIYICVSFLD